MKLIPDKRLLISFAILCLPLSLISAIRPETTLYAYILTGLFIIVTMMDALLSIKTKKNFIIEFPDIIRLSKNKEGKIPITLLSEHRKRSIIRIGLAFPKEIHSKDFSIHVTLNKKLTGVVWPVTGLKQGKYLLNHYYIEIRSYAGFWLNREKRLISCEIRVYPDIFSEQKTLAAIFSKNGTGMHIRKFSGKGREFDKLRDYVSGDSYYDIHWKATAKRGQPVSKVYQIERTQDIYLMIDASRLSARNAEIVSSPGISKIPHRRENEKDGHPPSDTIFDRYITGALTLGLAAERQGDNFGVGFFSDKMKGLVRAKSGKAHFNACRDMLYTAEPDRVSPDFSEFFSFLGTRIQKRSLMIILTSLDDPVLSENFIKNIHMLSRRHLVLTAMVKPGIATPLFSSENVTDSNDIFRNLAGHSLWYSLRETERALYRHGTGFILLDHQELSLQLLNRYIEIKQRQLI